MNSTPWRDQPIEQARLLNPAFLGTLLFYAAQGFQEEHPDDHGMPFSLAFVALPVILHKGTREALPKTIRTSLPAWLSVNTFVQVGFAERARAVVPLARQSISVAIHGQLLTLSGSAIQAAGDPQKARRFASGTQSEEVKECLKKAHFVGRWFAHAGDHLTILALWGVRP